MHWAVQRRNAGLPCREADYYAHFAAAFRDLVAAAAADSPAAAAAAAQPAIIEVRFARNVRRCLRASQRYVCEGAGLSGSASC